MELASTCKTLRIWMQKTQITLKHVHSCFVVNSRGLSSNLQILSNLKKSVVMDKSLLRFFLRQELQVYGIPTEVFEYVFIQRPHPFYNFNLERSLKCKVLGIVTIVLDFYLSGPSYSQDDLMYTKECLSLFEPM